MLVDGHLHLGHVLFFDSREMKETAGRRLVEKLVRLDPLMNVPGTKSWPILCHPSLSGVVLVINA